MGGRVRPGALLLAPGAGADRTHRTLVAVEAAVAPLPVSRMDFPARKAGRRSPDRPAVAVAAVRDEAADLVATQRIRPDRLVLGGRSFGGRMCSLAVAEGLPAAGLVLLSYPLHPPGRPDRWRIDHFPDLGVPCLFVSGDRDPFGSPDELAEAVTAIPARVDVVIVPGAHDPRGQDEVVAGAVRDWLRAWTRREG
jgi:predicted alpha/beta-hydrolase family hydrolase